MAVVLDPIRTRRFTVRQAVAGDESAIRSLRLQALMDAPEAFGSTYERELARTAEDWQRWLAPGVTLILESDGLPRGLVAGVHDASDAAIVHLMAMWLHRACRGASGADALMAMHLEWARVVGATTVEVHVFSTNEPARRLYERHGFRATDETVKQDGRVELRMRLPLGTSGRARILPRLDERVRAWRVEIERMSRTPRAIVAFGLRDDAPVVLKVADSPSGESRAGEVLEAFGGRGVVRVLEHSMDAVLMERVMPGTALADDVVDDHEATEIIAEVIRRMSPAVPPTSVPTVDAWAASFRRAAGGVPMISRSLVEIAEETYLDLCASQSGVRLLHGDLHHHNVLRDSRQGWIAIDPKGVIGELAYEVGAALRNPCERPEIFADRAVIERRVHLFARRLGLDPSRILRWAFAQAVLAAIWEWEDEGTLTAGLGWIELARAIHPQSVS